jgi:hypothetical protein
VFLDEKKEFGDCKMFYLLSIESEIEPVQGEMNHKLG